MIPFLDFLSPIIEKALSFIPDPQMKAAAQLKIQEELDRNSEAILDALVSVDKAQAATNIEEAKSLNLFIAGWRPFCGWVCATAFAWSFVLQPMASFLLTVIGHPTTLPALDLSQMMPVLLGMLGLGGMRSWEKAQNVHNEH